ncbi:uncharacterized protein C12orf60-like [Carettochelys insculpta]|uniref:uncharacterized protein C12orf60-like n=1 Tax=Carettochelys insculpta TaxID=44489 RepID=UPI003EBA9138
MLSVFSDRESERERLLRASQALYDALQGCVSATRVLLQILDQHLNTSVSLAPMEGSSSSVRQTLEHLLGAAREIRCTAEQTDRHVQKNTSRNLYARMASPNTSLKEKVAIVQDFHQATMGIFGSVGGPIAAVLLWNARLPERLEAALRQAVASPVLCLPMDALLWSSEDLAKALPAPPTCWGLAGETAAGPPENSLSSHTRVVQTLQDCLPDVLTGRRARDALAAAAEQMEEARQALAPACKCLQLTADTAEVYMALIREQQPGRAREPGQNPVGIAHWAGPAEPW